VDRCELEKKLESLKEELEDVKQERHFMLEKNFYSRSRPCQAQV
jgi:hypothetical protein